MTVTATSRTEDRLGKARRILAMGWVTVVACDDLDAIALVRGDHGEYRVEWHHGAWSCSCPAFGECSHELAVRLCTTLTPPGGE